MKAEELMRFDWVSLEDDDTPRQVDWIRSGEVGLFWNKNVTPPYLKPVPLTAEILEKNGFERSEVFVEWKYENDNVYMIYKPFPYLKIQMEECIIAFPCKYIHQLQHALRLCGIEKTIEL